MKILVQLSSNNVFQNHIQALFFMQYLITAWYGGALIWYNLNAIAIYISLYFFYSVRRDIYLFIFLNDFLLIKFIYCLHVSLCQDLSFEMNNNCSDVTVFSQWKRSYNFLLLIYFQILWLFLFMGCDIYCILILVLSSFQNIQI